MWKHCGYNQVSPAYDYCEYDQVSPAYDNGSKCSTFVLIVVLFILLIIVGSTFC